MQPPVLHPWPPEPVLRATARSLMWQYVGLSYYGTTTRKLREVLPVSFRRAPPRSAGVHAQEPCEGRALQHLRPRQRGRRYAAHAPDVLGLATAHWYGWGMVHDGIAK